MRKQPENNIGWCHGTINPVKGICPHLECEIRKDCYAIRRYKRFKWDPILKLNMSVFDALENMEPSRIFVGSTCELFHEDIPPEWLYQIIEKANDLTQHTFLFLTKCPENADWEFESHVWLGATVTSSKTAYRIEILKNLKTLGNVDHIFVSFEPVLASLRAYLRSILNSVDWVMIGAQTPYSKESYPDLNFVEELLFLAREAGVPVWMKENLLRQEVPRTVVKDVRK